MKKLLVAFSCAFMLGSLGVRSASADVFNFSFSSASNVGSGTFTANPTGSSGVYQITGITGTLNGFAITSLLAPNSFPTAFGASSNDNRLYYPPSIPSIDVGQALPSVLDFLGVSFVSAGLDWNLYYGSDAAVPTPANTGYNLFYPDQVSNDLLETFTLTPASVNGDTPEPSALILLATGVAGLAGLVRRRTFRT